MLAAERFHEEIYFPWAFTKDNEVVGGAYIYTWMCGAKSQEKLASLSKKPIEVFVTGSCLFGDGLLGVDQHKKSHSLANYRLEKEGLVFNNVYEDKTQQHPYEKMLQGMMQNFGPLIKACSPAAHSQILFHLPVPEYIIEGIKMVIHGQMTFDAFYHYVELIIAKGQEIQEAIQKISDEYAIDITFTSPLHSLGLHLVSTLQQLLLPLQLVPGQDKANKIVIEKNVASSLLHLLISQHEDIGKNIWTLFHNQVNQNELDLSTLNHISYAAHVAIAAQTYGRSNVCLLDMANEVLIGRSYTKYFATTLGAILCMHWLPPVYLHDNGYNEIFYCGANKNVLNTVLTTALTEAPLQTGQYVYHTLKWNSLFAANPLSSMQRSIKKIIHEYATGEKQSPEKEEKKLAVVELIPSR